MQKCRHDERYDRCQHPAPVSQRRGEHQVPNAVQQKEQQASNGLTKGKRLGRPPRVFDRRKVIKMSREGKSLGAIAKAVGISRTHAHRLVKAAGP